MLSRFDKLLSVSKVSHVISKIHVWLKIHVSAKVQVWIESHVDSRFQVVSNIHVWVKFWSRAKDIEQIDGSQIQVAPLSICHILSQPSQFSRFQSSHCSY